MNNTYTCYIFLSPNDTVLRKLTELDVMITQKGMPEDESNISHLIELLCF